MFAYVIVFVAVFCFLQNSFKAYLIYLIACIGVWLLADTP